MVPPADVESPAAPLLSAAGFADRLERMGDPPVVVIASATAVTTLKELPGAGRQIMVFADTDALQAAEAIATHKPNLIVLQREFLDTQRCAALISRVKADPDLSHEITARSLKTALKKLTDVVWTAERGDKNAMIYALIGSEADQYRKDSKGGY